MSDTNRLSLAYVKEVSYGVFPSGPPTLKELRFTGESVAQENETVTSQEIRSDRQKTGLLRTGVRCPGDLNFEFSYGAFDEWWEWGLLADATWSTPVANTATCAITIGGVLTGTGIGSGVAVNDWVEVRGFVNAGNNGYFKVTAQASGSLTLVGTTSAFVAETGVAGVSVSHDGSITNGVTLATFAGEKNFQDATAGSRFEQDLGMGINRVRLEMPVKGIIGGTWGLIGKRAISATATGGTGSNTAAAQNTVQTGTDNVLSILENYVPQQTISANFELVNNLRERLVLGALGAISLGTGSIDLTGQHTSYYSDKAIIDKALNQTESALAYVLQESAATRAVVFDFPKIKYSNGKRVGGGLNQDVIADMSWTAYRHPTEGKTVRITRFA